MTEAFAILSILGLALGSFLSSCAYRLPREISLVTVRSFCPNCGHGISWVGLIPIIGFLSIKGRCESCDKRIPASYPLTEILSAGVIVGLALLYGATFEFVMALILSFLLVLVAIIDAKHFVIPNQLILAGTITGIGLVVLGKPEELVEVALSGVGSLAVMAAIRAGGNKTFNRETMGMGDVKLAGVIGLFVGFIPFLVALWGASIAGMVYGFIKIRNTKSKIRNKSEIPNSKHRIPFGTFLAVFSLLVFFFKSEVLGLLELWLTWNP